MFTRLNFLNYFLQVVNGLVPIFFILYLNGNASLTFMGFFFKSLAIIGLVQLFVDYGFNYSGIRAYKGLISQNASQQDKFNYFFNVMVAKCLISSVGLLCYLLYRSFQPNPFDLVELAFILMGVVFSLANFSWFFFASDISLQFNFILLFLRICSFFILFVYSVSLDTVLLINFAPYFLSNVFLLLYVLIKKRVALFSITRPSLSLASIFKEGWGVFSNGIFISFISMVWPLVFFRLLNAELVGVYGIGDRILRGLKNLLGPIPFFVLSYAGNHSLLENLISIKKRFKIGFLAFLLFVPLSFVFIPSSVLQIFLKGDIINFRGLLNIFVFSFIPAALNSIFYSILIAISKERQYLLYFIFSFVAAILLGFFINTFIFMPLFLEFILAAILFYKLYIRSRYENINRSLISSLI